MVVAPCFEVWMRGIDSQVISKGENVRANCRKG